MDPVKPCHSGGPEEDERIIQEQERLRIPGGSECGRSPSAQQEVRCDLLYDTSYERSRSSLTKNSDEWKLKDDGDDEELRKIPIAYNSKVSYTHGLHPLAYLLNVASGRAIRLSICSNNKYNNSILDDAKPETADLDCTFYAASFENMPEQPISCPSEWNLRSYSTAQINSPRPVTSPRQIHPLSHEEPVHFLDDRAAACYPHSHILATPSSPVPIPSTPRSDTFGGRCGA
ncbi:hypothetical protein EI94DRAFT_1869192 [Lactarius quietus]|nr:hypothetical protein EI94DRAFT_1869192 [Lactarius quietus]